MYQVDRVSMCGSAWRSCLPCYRFRERAHQDPPSETGGDSVSDFISLIIVNGTIGSIEDLNIILDTGTSPTTISTDIAQRLNLSGNSELQMTLDGMVQVQSAILSHIQMGGLCADSLSVVVQDLSFVGQRLGMRIAGIAGLDVLSSGNFTIDYRKRKIFFGRSAATKKSVHFERRAPFLTVKAKIDGRELQLLVDSGTPGILIYGKRLETGSERRHFDNTLVETAAGTFAVRVVFRFQRMAGQ
jgi:predicted aspartyl protease